MPTRTRRLASGAPSPGGDAPVPAPGSSTVIRRRQHRLLALFWVLLLALYAATISTAWKTPDVTSAEAASWRIAHTGEPWVDGLEGDLYILRIDVDETFEPWSKLILFSTTNAENGHAVITRTPGVIAAGVPAYWIQARLDPGSADSLSAVPGALTGALLAAATVLLLLLAVRDLVPFRALLGLGLAVGLATPYWSVLADALWTHGVTTLGIAGMAWAARRERWWLVGLFGGVGLWGRLHVVVIVAVLGLALAAWRRRPAIALSVGLVSSAFLAAAFVWGRWTYGVWDIAGASGGYSYGASRLAGEDRQLGVSNVLGYLVSPGAGLFVWTPVLLVLVPAVIRGWRSAPDWTRVLAIGGVLYLLVQASLNQFHAGTGFWGNRLGLETLTCLVPLVACCLSRVRPRERVVAVVALTYQSGLVLTGAVFNIAHNHGFAWRENDLVLAFRDNPWAVGAGMATGIVLAVLAARVVMAPAPLREPQPSAEPAT